MNLYEVLTNDRLLDNLTTLQGESLSRDQKIDRLEKLTAKRRKDRPVKPNSIPF